MLITNNKLVYEKYKDQLKVIYDEEFNYVGILEMVRNKIHEGYGLLTHPLSGSVKPNETPYKSILLSDNKSELDTRGLMIVEESILTAKKFLNDKQTPNWTERILDDFRVIDYSLISNVINKM
ncbi:MAG: GrdX protein [Tissierellia bacterium]|jgi:hypothetical protein|nr:GrdX protein [Tissierellia bacterium]